MKKIVFIGGGSAKFVRELTTDLLAYDNLNDIRITLMDIDRERVDRSERIVQKIICDRGVPASVDSTLDSRRALDGADYVIITIMVGGIESYRADVAIPAKYGVLQVVSDTTGPGGVFRTIRTAPVLGRLAAEIAELCPRAWVLNYANPMSMNVLALERCGIHRVVGLCHSIQHLQRSIGDWLSLPAEQIRYTAGGINHVNFYLTATHEGRDLYPRLLAEKQRIIENDPAERTRFELLEYLGYIPAEGPYHQSEYYPWFRKNEEMVRHYAADTGWGLRVDSLNIEQRKVEIEEQIAGRKPISYARSVEYGAQIIHALEGGRPEPFYGNVPNRGLIENLPADGIVEVPCTADGNGIVAGRAGAIPPQLAAVMQPHMALHALAVSGTFEKDRRRIYQAVQADPLTGAILTLPKIREMVDEMFAANADYVAEWLR
jgi:alpha-galactosidase